MTNDNFLERLQAYTGVFHNMTDSITANYMAHFMLYRQMLQQANMGAFRDAFELCAVACIAIIPLILFIKGIKKEKQES